MNFLNLITRVQELAPWFPKWTIAVGIAFVALLIMFVAQDALMRVMAYHFGRRGPLLKSLFLRARGLVRFGLIILAVQLVAPMLPVSAEILSLIQHTLSAGLVVLAGWIVLLGISLFAEQYERHLRLDDTNNLHARKAATQIRILKRAVDTLIVILTLGFALMTFDSVRQFGVSIFASAGVAGLVIGFAAQPVLSNLVAGIQIAITQPIRIDDAVLVENEYGWVEELTATYIVVRLWDLRRLVLPLSYFLNRPFQNWTRSDAALIGSVILYLDYSAPIERIRRKFEELVKAAELWDGGALNLQVIDARERTIEVRGIMGAASAGDAWNLRCEVREKLLAFIQQEIPTALPRRRNETVTSDFGRGDAVSESAI